MFFCMFSKLLAVQLLFSIRTNQPEVQTNRKYKPTGSTNQLLFSIRTNQPEA